MNHDYRNLKVTAELRDPIILDRYQPLDGILGAVTVEDPELRQRSREYRTYRRMVERHGLSRTHAIFREKGWELPGGRGHFLPLDVWGHGAIHGRWVYCASWAIPGEFLEHGLAYFNHHFDFELAGQFVKPGRKRVYTGKGEFKSEHIPLQTTTTESLTWYVRGIQDEVEEILSTCYAIGKKRNRGYGGVRRWLVEPVECDRSVFTPAGELMRPVPADLLERLAVRGDFQYSWTTYRPPYWVGRYVAKCAVSGIRNGARA